MSPKIYKSESTVVSEFDFKYHKPDGPFDLARQTSKYSSRSVQSLKG